jgi:type II and III secretion system protein
MKCLKHQVIIALTAIFLTLVSGCTTTSEKTSSTEPEQPGSFFDQTGGKSLPQNVPKDEIVRPSESSYLQVINIEPSLQSPKTPKEAGIAPEKLPFDLSNKKKKMRVFNFSDAPFPQIVSLFSKELGFQYLLTDDIKNKTTMICEMELTAQEVWDIFLQILANANLYYTIQNQLLVIRPMSEAGQTHTVVPERTNIGVQVFLLKHLDSKNMATQLAPFISKGVKIIELPSQNAIMLMDNKEVIDKIREIISYLDQPAQANWYKAVFQCKQVPSQRIAEELGQLLPVLGLPVSINGNKDTPESMKITSLERLQLLVVSAPTAGALDAVREWIGRLDTNEVGDQEQVYIYRVQNSTADSLAEVLSVMFALKGSMRVPDLKTGDTKSQSGVVANVKSIASEGGGATGGTKSTGTTAGKTGTTATAAAGNIYDAAVRIYADGVNNTLTIRTKPRTYSMIKAILDRHDILPKQVLVQVLVVEISLNDLIKFGVEFSMSGGSGNVETLGGTNYKNLNPRSDNEYGGRFNIFNPKNPNEKYGYVQALSGITNVKVLSSPQVLVVSHSQAHIAVGNKVPLVNSEITNSQSSVVTTPDDVSTSLVRNINYEDTGIILKIIPQVTHSNHITLIMDQTVSEAVRNSTSNIDSPEIQSRTMQTTMMIKDGQTVLCGGMIKEKTTDNLDSLPFIDQIPFLRRLVGDTDYQKERTEMLILVTGTIITSENHLEGLLKQYRQAVSLLQNYHKRGTTFEQAPRESSKIKDAGWLQK